MSGFIPFTDEQKEKARRTDLVGLLRSQGETLHKSGSELEWLDGSQKVTIRGNLWFHQYEQVGGDSIDFVKNSTTNLTRRQWNIYWVKVVECFPFCLPCKSLRRNLNCRLPMTICAGCSLIC